MSKLSFIQRTERQIKPLTNRTVEAEIGIGDVTLSIHRFTRPSRYYGETGPKEEFVSVRLEAFTDTTKIWCQLDKLGVFDKIEKTDLRGSDDLARLLVECGLRHVPNVGYQFERDGGAAELARIKALHAAKGDQP